MVRAILRKTKLIVLDEATANVDLETDNLIQQKLRSSFKDSTVIVIAHRLATVIDSNRILVMHSGEGVEFDHPFKLLVKSDTDTSITSDGFFAKMLQASDSQTANSLFQIARQNYL